MTPAWLHPLSLAMVSLGVACAAVLAIDVVRRPQKMAVMNLVWPIDALFGSLLWLWFYFRWGRARPDARTPPFAVMVAKAASHCGSGCTLGDIVAETLALLAPGVLLVFGWGHLFEERTYANWTLDFVFAFAIGIAFQYFTIVPMRHLRFWPGVWAAVKADTLSLASWQLGMYGFMGWAKFQLFGQVWQSELEPSMPEFWFAMQIAMLCGFATSYPVNWWLVRRGWKERM